jgi:hypothetical protein
MSGLRHPDPPPAAGVLADMCAIQAWNHDLDFDTRRLLEWSADTIRAILIANGRYANRVEHLEAESATYAALLYGPNQRGGAA